jgi:transposase
MAPGGSAQPYTKLYDVDIRSNRNNKLRAYYDKKCDEGKLLKVAIIACVNTLIHTGFLLS